jgi:hypothetical protein
MRILAIDPGTTQSAHLLWDGETAQGAIVSNAEVRTVIHEGDYDVAAIEMVACYGMAVGKEVFETCLWIGRFEECWLNSRHLVAAVNPKIKFRLVYRRDIKHHFCNSAKAKDANIRQAILDRFGGKDKAIGKKANQGPLYGIKSHLWSALAIALYVQDQNGRQA